MVEYAFAQYMFRKYKNNKQDCGVKSGCITDQANDDNADSGASRPSRSSVLKLLPMKTFYIDAYSQILFPTLFFTFMILYFLYFLSIKGYTQPPNVSLINTDTQR